MKRIIEWWRHRDGLERGFMGLVAAILLLLALAIILESNEKAEFMRECEQDHPKYECTAMWRSGNKVIVQ